MSVIVPLAVNVKELVEVAEEVRDELGVVVPLSVAYWEGVAAPLLV